MGHAPEKKANGEPVAPRDKFAAAKNPDGTRDERLVALMQQAEHIAETSGRAPMSWEHFRDKIEMKSLGSTAGLTGGLALGVAAGVMVGVLGAALSLHPVLVTVLAVGGAVAGATAGRKPGVYDIEQHDRLVERYREYLAGCEHVADRGHTLLQQKDVTTPQVDFVTRLQQQQQNAPSSSVGL